MGQIKARNFEIPYSGGFQLTDYFPGLEDYFEIGKEVACYSNLDEAALLIKHYLNHEEERLKIVRDAQNRVVQQHGYRHRIRNILQGLS